MDHHQFRSPGAGSSGPYGGAYGRRRDAWSDRDHGMGMGMGFMSSYREPRGKEELVDVTYTERLKKCELILLQRVRI